MTLTMMKNSFGTAPCLMMETLEANFLACLVEHSQGSTSTSVTPNVSILSLKGARGQTVISRATTTRSSKDHVVNGTTLSRNAARARYTPSMCGLMAAWYPCLDSPDAACPISTG